MRLREGRREGRREGGWVDNQELRMFGLDMEWELVGIAIGKLFKLAVAIVQSQNCQFSTRWQAESPLRGNLLISILVIINSVCWLVIKLFFIYWVSCPSSSKRIIHSPWTFPDT